MAVMAPPTACNESDEIANYEDDGICPWTQAGDLLTVEDDYMSEADVYRGAEECRADRETDKVSPNVNLTVRYMVDGKV